MNIHVPALPHDASHSVWDYPVRVSQPGEDASSARELSAESGDNADYPPKDAAVEAGLRKDYAMIDKLLD